MMYNWVLQELHWLHSPFVVMSLSMKHVQVSGMICVIVVPNFGSIPNASGAVSNDSLGSVQ